MTSEPDDKTNLRKGRSDDALPLPTCSRCGQPLKRAGLGGECLRCSVGMALFPDEETPHAADAGDAQGTGRRIRYGHFEVVIGEDGFPVELGSGGMAITYRAYDTVLHSAVALKVINENVLEHPSAQARFLREARAAAQLNHPNVANVTFYGEQDGECYYVMELVEGETLEARVRREGPLPPASTLEIGVQVARALAAAEACGLVHRDLKPSNVMLAAQRDEDGGSGAIFVKVIDWGLAKAVNSESTLGADQTRHGFVGTPAFASPEQFASASERRIDMRSDIYSLGVTIWYLLCGRTPFVGPTLEVIHAQQGKPPYEQLAAARVPKRLVVLLKAMLAPDPAVRPQSARELLVMLRGCQEFFGAATTPVRRRRSRRLALAFGVVAVAAVAAGWWHERNARPAVVVQPAAVPAGTPGLPSPTPQPHRPPEHTIAVLPFENLGPDKADAFFALGVQDGTSENLARIADLKVIASDSTRAYAPQEPDLARVSRDLMVRYLLAGSVRRQDGELHVRVRLMDSRDSTRVWAGQYDRRLADLFAVQSEITRALAAYFEIPLSEGEKAAIDRPPTGDLAAHDLYLRARGGNAGLQTREEKYHYTLQTRVPLLEQAVAHDPNFAVAFCDLVEADDVLVQYELANAQPEVAAKHRAQAEAALASARRLRPNAGETHLAQALHFNNIIHDQEQARIELEPARRAMPNCTAVERLAGEIAVNQGRWNEAVHTLQKVVSLDPRNSDGRYALARVDHALRHYDDFDRELWQIIIASNPRESAEIRLLRSTARLETHADLEPLQEAIDAVRLPDEPPGEVIDKYRLVAALCAHDAYAMTTILANTTPSRLVFGGVPYPKAWFEALAARMRHDERGAQAAFRLARVDAERTVQTDPANGRTLGVLAMIDAGLGRRDDAVREALHACELCPLEKLAWAAPVVSCDLAVVYAWTNQPEQACDVLELWVDRPAGFSLPGAPTYGDFLLDPIWDPLRGDARFNALVARLAPQTTH